MNGKLEQDWRKKRLSDLAKTKGGNARLGRLLGYRDGAYVGHMIGGLRPITEKTIEKIHQMHGLSDWFKRDGLTEESAHQPPAAEEDRATYGWPFVSIKPEDWASIPRHKREVIEEQIRGMVSSQQTTKLAA
jgi:hypothetical protein